MNSVTGLQSAKSAKRLEQISNLRALGISDKIDLPQLVVCGDQSAGKSSVLEGITGIPFPREEGICTKFATEVILEHNNDATTITAKIIPNPLRQVDDKIKLDAYHRTIDGFEQLPAVIAEVGALMGLRGYGENAQGSTFAEDVLQIRFRGPCNLHLSIVDLPGLISTASEDQSDHDVDTIHSMVDHWIGNSRTIILAVVQASNDIANQSIIRKSKRFDQKGQRTVGIITKPDLINAGSEARIATLAKNQDTTKLQLGFYLLKNPSPKERAADATHQDRCDTEQRFFHASPWKELGLDPSRVGIERLKHSLQSLLDHHIKREMPKVCDEIKAMIVANEQQLALLPPERPTIGHLRLFLSDLAMRYHTIATAAVNGEYSTVRSSFFAVDGGTPELSEPSGSDSSDSESSDSDDDVAPTIQELDVTRLRAAVHHLNSNFAEVMLGYGQKYRQGKRVAATQPATKPSVEQGSLLKSYNVDKSHVMTEAETTGWVKKVYHNTRGRELSGNANHVLVSELFHEQAQPWQHIATRHVEMVYETVKKFVEKAIDHLKIEPHVRDGLMDSIETAMCNSWARAESGLAELIADEHEQHPITYNHYYTTNVQKARLDKTQKMIEAAIGDCKFAKPNVIGGGQSLGPNLNIDTLISSLRDKITVDMSEQACADALEGLNAYYKVAMKTFVDNVCRQVVERHLLRNLADLFSPRMVAMYTEEELEQIAGENDELVSKRRGLIEDIAKCRAGLLELRK